MLRLHPVLVEELDLAVVRDRLHRRRHSRVLFCDSLQRKETCLLAECWPAVPNLPERLLSLTFPLERATL